MDVDVDIGRVDRHIEHSDRIAAGRQEGVVGLHNSCSEQPVLYAAPVNEQHDVIALRVMQRGAAHVAGHERLARRSGQHLVFCRRQGHELPARFKPHHLQQTSYNEPLPLVCRAIRSFSWRWKRISGNASA